VSHGQDDLIRVRGLEVMAHVGVPEEERAAPQKLLIDLEITPRVSFEQAEDQIERTVDYDVVCQHVRAVVADYPRRLIETLAAEIAAALLKNFNCGAVSVEIFKFVLEGTNHVSVRCTRSSD